MKLFLKIILSVLLAIAGLLLLEAFVSTGLKNNKDFKISYVRNRTINAGIVAHGPCEPEWMIDPKILQKYIPYKVYNLALNHSDFADNYIFLEQYIAHQQKPKAVLLYVTPESFDSVVANTFNTYRFVHLLHDKTVREVVGEMDPKYKRTLFIPFMKYSYYSNFIYYKAFSGWFNYLRKDTVSRWPDGHVAPVMSYQHEMLEFRYLRPEGGNFLWSQSREKYFIKLIELLRKNNIPLIAYESPVYYEALPLQNNRKERLAKIDSICSLYKVPYYRFDTLSMQFDKKNYFTSYNMTVAGNEIFNNFFGSFLRDSLPHIIKQ